MSLPSEIRGSEDICHLQSLLHERAPSLFVADQSKANLEVLFQNTGELVSFSTSASLERFLRASAEDGKSKFFIISQRNSWTRLKITFDMFKMTCNFYRVFPRWLESVFMFGLKTCSSDAYIDGCFHRRVHGGYSTAKFGTASTVLEIGYRIHYFERHGRDLKDPWVPRQCAVYQNYSCEKGVSTWILIQVPIANKQLLSSIDLHASDEVRGQARFSLASHPMSTHLSVLFYCSHNWRVYLSSLGDELKTMNQGISFQKRYEEYGLNFSSSQRLSYIRQRLENSLMMLEANRDVGRMLQEHAVDAVNYSRTPSSSDRYFKIELHQYKIEVDSHIRNIKRHLRFSEDIRMLVLKIMDFRHDELVRQNGDSLRLISEQTASDNKNMVAVAHEAAADSRTMKIATIIAMIYLPASLVATFFSTGFVQFDSQGSSFKLVVRKEVWLFFAVTVSLMACTIASAYFFGRHRKRKPFYQAIP